MKMVLVLIGFFVAGLVLDWIVTIYTRAVAHGKTVTASILAMVITVINFSVMAYILQGIDGNMGGVFSFALGNGAGTGLAMYKKRGI